MKAVLGPTAASLLIGNENVDLRILPVTHVVHERDLRPHEIEIADAAIEKDAELDGRRNGVVGRRLLRLRGENREGRESSKQIEKCNASKTHEIVVAVLALQTKLGPSQKGDGYFFVFW